MGIWKHFLGDNPGHETQGYNVVLSCVIFFDANNFSPGGERVCLYIIMCSTSMWEEEVRDSNFFSKKHITLKPEYLKQPSTKPFSSSFFPFFFSFYFFLWIYIHVYFFCFTAFINSKWWVKLTRNFHATVVQIQCLLNSTESLILTTKKMHRLFQR